MFLFSQGIPQQAATHFLLLYYRHLWQNQVVFSKTSDISWYLCALHAEYSGPVEITMTARDLKVKSPRDLGTFQTEKNGFKIRLKLSKVKH
jgi:hypothetical protein